VGAFAVVTAYLIAVAALVEKLWLSWLTEAAPSVVQVAVGAVIVCAVLLGSVYVIDSIAVAVETTPVQATDAFT
jgi:hypothetical protein